MRLSHMVQDALLSDLAEMDRHLRLTPQAYFEPAYLVRLLRHALQVIDGIGRHIAPTGLTSEALPGGGSREYQRCAACGAELNDLTGDQSRAYPTGTRVGTGCPGQPVTRKRGTQCDSRARKSQKPSTTK